MCLRVCVYSTVGGVRWVVVERKRNGWWRGVFAGCSAFVSEI